MGESWRGGWEREEGGGRGTRRGRGRCREGETEAQGEQDWGEVGRPEATQPDGLHCFHVTTQFSPRQTVTPWQTLSSEAEHPCGAHGAPDESVTRQS